MKPFTLFVLYLISAFVDAQRELLGAKPRIIKVETVSDLSLLVTWRAPPRSTYTGRILGYHIVYSHPGVGHKESVDSSCTKENCNHELTNLKPFTEYSVGVVPYGSSGDGSMSDTVNQTTAQGVPYSIPGPVNCEPVSSKELRVSWARIPSAWLHGIFKSYKVIYYPSYWFNKEDKKEYKVTMTNGTVLNGLKSDTHYAINVLASNSMHDGYQSDTIYCRTKEDVPDEPIDVKALYIVRYETEKVLVSWLAPLVTNGKIVHYKMYYRKPGNETKARRVPVSKTSCQIFGLEKNETYEFWVTASSKAGEGPASEHVTCMIGVSSAPQISNHNLILSVRNDLNAMLPCDTVGTPNITFSWKVNGDNIIPNERYHIYPDGSLLIRVVTRDDANNYTCIAENAFGRDSVTHKLVIVQGSARSPVVTILSTTADEITVQLSSNGADPVPDLGFELSYKLDTDMEQTVWKKVKGIPNLQPYIISNCTCGSRYLIYARGYNYVGSGGDASENFTVRTNGSKPIAPSMSDFIGVSAERITLHLSTWTGNGCPISHFFVEYKEKQNMLWRRIRNKLQPDTDFGLNLEPRKMYNIRVTAHNDAGVTIADYEVATRNK